MDRPELIDGFCQPITMQQIEWERLQYERLREMRVAIGNRILVVLEEYDPWYRAQLARIAQGLEVEAPE